MYESRMHYVSVQGRRVPALGLGTWKLTGGACTRAVSLALQIGYRHIDTAQAYANEAEIGSAIRDSRLPRSSLFLTSKVWLGNLAPAAVKASAELSLSKFRTDYIDLLLIHWPSEKVAIERTLDALRSLQENGKIQHLGVSNFTPSLIERVVQHSPILCNQIEFHPFLSQQRHLNLAREHDYMITAYAPLARGRVRRDKTLRAIAEKHQKTAAQVALRWLIDHGNVAAIPKASSRAHLEENLDIFDFELDDDDRSGIADCERGKRLVNPEFAPEWRV